MAVAVRISEEESRRARLLLDGDILTPKKIEQENVKEREISS